MVKVAVMLAQGFEEIEALTVVDVLRRANITCDMIVLPGGMPGSAHLRDNQTLIQELQSFEQEGKKLAAICAAPIALNQAEILKNKRYTCYDGVQEQILDGHYVKETVVVDGQLTTSRGPSTALAFAYELVEQLGGDAESLRTGMLYRDVFGKNQ
ncbi:4-methyl-5(b-hydroxyethyl)-thiazole monophosphate biosynthesis protein [Streptococcus pneumoniae]|nr:4-methyl-5(b-hydroxyethyl)-thiazole monophosphate biosynthesis protein [Streptococcus pneumoniae]